MKVVALVGDLITASRILEAASRNGADALRVDGIDDLPAPASVDLLLVDWGDHGADWGRRLAAWRADAPTRIVLFGPHTDLEAHAAARGAGLGPMWARSRLMRDLNSLVQTAQNP